MDFKTFIIKKKENFKEYWEVKIFKLAFFIHIFYFSLSLILFFTVTHDKNDFLTYFNVGKQVITNLPDLYNEANYDYPFRYFPISAFLFVPFYLLGYDWGFLVFQFLNLITNYFICILMVKCILVNSYNDEINKKRVILYVSIFLAFISHVFNYALGQINSFVALFLLISIYIFLSKKSYLMEIIGGICLGIGIIIKPIAVFIIPFIILVKIELKKKKLNFDFVRSLLRLIGVIIPLSFNILFFVFIPDLWSGFLEVNFLGTTLETVNYSFSITRLVMNAFILNSVPIGSFLIFLVIFSIIGILGIFIFLIRTNSQFDISHAFSFGLLIMLLVYFDSWDHHLIILGPILSITFFHSSNSPKIFKKFVKPSFFGLGFFCLFFTSLWLLIKDICPYNFVPTIFLLLCFYGLIKFSIKTDKRNKV